jgi:hypothetical protein
MLLQFLKPRIDEQTERYNSVCERNRNNGQKGGRPRKNLEKPNETQENPLGFLDANSKPNETQENPIKDKGYKDIGIKDKGKKKKEIIIPIPTIEEVEEYIKAKGYTIDARAFWAYYDAREWTKDGKPIKNWHLQIATWVKNSNTYDNKPRQQAGAVDMFSDAEREAAMKRIEAAKAEAGRRQAEKERLEREEAERVRIERLNRLTGFDYQPNNNNNDE